MKKIFLFLICFCLLTPMLKPQHVNDKQIQVGLDNIYNFNWTNGLKAFNTFINKYPADPSGYHFKSIIYLWYYLGNLNDAYLDTFNLLTDKSIELAELLNEKEPSVEMFYLLGSVYYNKSIAEARSNNYLQALWTSNQMKQNLEEAIKIDPDYYDAFLGLGLYNFALSQIPSSLEWAANLIGISANKELGLNYVKKTVQKGKLSKVDAQYYLSQLYSRVIVDNDEAKDLLHTLVRRYPKNLLFNFSLAWIEFELNDLKSSEKHLRTIINSKEKYFPFIVSNSSYLLGNVFFARNQFDSAFVYYAKYLKIAVNDDYKGIANYKAGICLELTGNRKEALKYFDKSSDGNSDIEENIYAERKGNDYKDRKLSAPEIQLIRHSNFIKQNKYSSAKDSLSNFLLQPKLTIELQAEAKLYLALASFYQNKYQESLDYTVECLNFKIENEMWIHAYANYFAAWNSYYLKKFVDAGLFLQQIKDIDEYDFSTSLENKIYSLQRILPLDSKK